MKYSTYLKLAVGLHLVGLLPLHASAQEQWDTYSDTWVAVDELGRNVANADEGVDRKEIDHDACVGMFYYIWHGYHNECGKDVTELLKENPENPDWGPEKSFHWGSKPWLGYYTAGDSYIMARHLQMLTDAGVDFLFLDVTNGQYYPYQIVKLMAEIDRREAAGLKVPKLAFTLHSRTAATIEKIYSVFYKNKDSKYWFYHEGKPLILADKNEIAGTVSDEILDYFTFRNSWAWMNGTNPDEWPWLEFYPQEPGWTLPEGSTEHKIEQISVSVAQHAHSKIGKSYHDGAEPEFDNNGLCKETPYGLYFQEQWNRALEVHPPIVMVTQFNEWIAQRFVISNDVELNYIRPGASAAMGETYFVDVYNAEFSRDLEPSSHPLVRDNYYLQLVSNIRRYRGARPIPVPTVNIPIDISKGFSQWDSESVEYRDDIDDAIYTSQSAQTPATLSRTTNDIIVSKVTQDDTNLYFYVRTGADMSDPKVSERWMRLFLNTDTDYTTGWWGYDYSVYKDPTTGIYSLMRHSKEFEWTTIAPVDYRVEDNQMHLAIPKNLMAITDYSDIDFKWADNVSDDNPDIMTFISDGDVAPNGRFNYRYKGASTTSTIDKVAADDSSTRLEITHNGGKTIFSYPHDTPMSLWIYDTNGTEYFRSEDNRNRTISCELPAGIYIARYRTETDCGSIKFIRP